jgi:hypothetical protein
MPRLGQFEGMKCYTTVRKALEAAGATEALQALADLMWEYGRREDAIADLEQRSGLKDRVGRE